VLKNDHAPELSGANCHAKLSRFIQLLKNILESPTLRKVEERRRDKTLAHTINVQTVTDGISRRLTSARDNTSLILVDHGVKVID